MGVFERTKNKVAQFDSKGQGTIEYVLLLVVIVSIGFGLLNQFFKPFGNYIKGITSTELKCSLETGELMGSEKLKDEGCVPTYQASAGNSNGSSGSNGQTSSSSSGVSSSGSSSSGSNNGSKNKNGSSSSGSSSGSSSSSSSSSGSSSSGGSSSSSSSSSGSSSSGSDKAGNEDSNSGDNEGVNDSSGRSGGMRVSKLIGRKGNVELRNGTSAADGAGVGDNTVSIEIGEEDKNSRSLRGWRNENRNKPRAITGYGVVEEDAEVKKSDKTTGVGDSKLVKKGEEQETKIKQLKLQNKSSSKDKSEEVENWSFSKWIRIAVIVLIVVAILIFLFFQILQITKSYEKN
jgi:hypothetical protein